MSVVLTVSDSKQEHVQHAKFQIVLYVLSQILAPCVKKEKSYKLLRMDKVVLLFPVLRIFQKIVMSRVQIQNVENAKKENIWLMDPVWTVLTIVMLARLLALVTLVMKSLRLVIIKLLV